METSGTPLKKIPQRGEAPGEFREETPSRCDPNDQRGECSDRRDRRDSIFAGRSAARPDLFGALHGVARRTAGETAAMRAGDAAGGTGGPPRYENGGMARIRSRSRGTGLDGAAVIRSQRQLPDHEHPRQHDRARHADGSTVQARLPVGARPRRDHRTSPRPAAHTSASGTARARKTTRPTTNCAAKGRRGIMRRLPCPAADRDRA